MGSEGRGREREREDERDSSLSFSRLYYYNIIFHFYIYWFLESQGIAFACNPNLLTCKVRSSPNMFTMFPGGAKTSLRGREVGKNCLHM